MITLAMPSFGNPEDVWHTLQSLRLYHPVTDCEILVVDNQGNETVKKICRDNRIRYEMWNAVNGTGPVRNKIFELAAGDFVLVIDSHVHLIPEAIKKLKSWLSDNWEDARNLIHGPLFSTSHQNIWTHYDNQWRSQMWGIWPKPISPGMIPEEVFEIEMMGCGLFGCRKDSWLGFTAEKGFGGVEGVIHEKYRRHGRKVLCLPFLGWTHRFRFENEAVPFPNDIEDRIKNFIMGFRELGMGLQPLKDHFGSKKIDRLLKRLKK